MAFVDIKFVAGFSFDAKKVATNLVVKDLYKESKLDYRCYHSRLTDKFYIGILLNKQLPLFEPSFSIIDSAGTAALKTISQDEAMFIFLQNTLKLEQKQIERNIFVLDAGHLD